MDCSVRNALVEGLGSDEAIRLVGGSGQTQDGDKFVQVRGDDMSIVKLSEAILFSNESLKIHSDSSS